MNVTEIELEVKRLQDLRDEILEDYENTRIKFEDYWTYYNGLIVELIELRDGKVSK